MASEDVMVSNFLTTKVFVWGGLGAAALLLVRYGKAVRSYLFSVVYTRYFLPKQTEKLHPFKSTLFADLERVESADVNLRNQGLIRVLEIGCGAGGNFQYFPKNCRVVCYDPNPHFRKHLFQHHAEFSHVCLERFVIAVGEDLSLTDDHSVDVVVSTLVNCSVGDIRQVLKEIRRVLAPGGRYYFLDHVIQPKGTGRDLLARFVKPLFWLVFDCDMRRDIASYIRNAGFSSVDIKEFDPEFGPPFGGFIKDFIMGCATK